MSLFHPGITKYLAERLADSILASRNHMSREEIACLAESSLNDHACRVAAIMGNDPSLIESLVWYRSDGWNHGGSATTWKDRCEELEADTSVKNALLDRAKPLLEEYFSELDCSGESNSQKAHQITKLLADIEHM